MLLYEMVAGCLPFAGSTPSEVLASILSEKEPQPLARYSRDVPAELERIVAKALRKDRDQRYISPQVIAWIYIGLGEKQQALEQLEKSYDNREDTMLWLNSDPALDDLRSEPEFQNLVRRVGLGSVL